MKYILLVLFTLLALHGNEKILELYRTQGIESVEKYLNEQLTKKGYWLEYLQSVNIQNGYYESIENIIRCNKNITHLQVYKNNGKLQQEIFSSDVIVGEAQGDKRIEGDLKTPIGVYQITELKTKLDQFYGPLAFVTNYPNVYDRIQGKTGSGIWIHGVPISGEREPYTKGCIALENDKLKDFEKQIDYANSIIIIDENKTIVSKDEIAMILANIFSWKQAWQTNDLQTYLSYYSDEFIKSNGMDLKNFTRYKTRIFKKNEKKSIHYKDINIIPYPNSLGKKMYQVFYFQEYQSSSFKSNNKKELYIEVINNTIKILYET